MTISNQDNQDKMAERKVNNSTDQNQDKPIFKIPY